LYKRYTNLNLTKTLENSEIIEVLRLTALLMDLHGENPFKIRGYQNLVFNLEKLNTPLSALSPEEIEKTEGIGKGMAVKIKEIIDTGNLSDCRKLAEITPSGIIEMLGIKGLGPKKVRAIWKDLGIEKKEDLLTACNENKISGLKGFGEKTQESIRQALMFSLAHRDKFLYAEIEETALLTEKKLKSIFPNDPVSLSGEIRRKMETVEVIQLIIGTDDPAAWDKISQLSGFETDKKSCGVFAWRGRELSSGAKVEIKIYPKEKFWNQLFIHSSSAEHLSQEAAEGRNFLMILKEKNYQNEEEIYKSCGMEYIFPEMREGMNELSLAREKKLPSLVTYKHLKGILHNHCTYSDGIHTLEEMAKRCKELGFEYLGISDHSKSAFYASGLQEFRVAEQHREIDKLNIELAPFKIFKGIESDILNDGNLDYDDEILSDFDFVIASIHSNLKMTEEKATQRLLKAIENPFTTILGHPTGRLLLKREGYPINHKMIIDACASNGVAIEINANPRRLDMDWRWVGYALEKGVMISINPDAHEMDGYYDMHFGVNIGRKAGLTKEMTLNAFSLREISEYFSKKKSGIKIS
jgi:DNA polymerase (family 10)